MTNAPKEAVAAEAYAQSTPDSEPMAEDEFEPTLEELQTLRHIGDKIPYTAWLVAVVELAERFTCKHSATFRPRDND